MLLPLLSFGCLLPSGFVILIEGQTLLRTHVHSKQPFVTSLSKDTLRNIISDLQRLEEKFSKSLDGSKELLQRELVGVFAQVESQLVLLLCHCGQPFSEGFTFSQLFLQIRGKQLDPAITSQVSADTCVQPSERL